MAEPHACLDCHTPLTNPRAVRCKSCAAKVRGISREAQVAGGRARAEQLAAQARLAQRARAAGLA